VTSEQCNLLFNGRDVLIRPLELELQDALYLRHDGIGHGKLYRAVARPSRESEGLPLKLSPDMKILVSAETSALPADGRQ
jgi:hypothetical protein